MSGLTLFADFADDVDGVLESASQGGQTVLFRSAGALLTCQRSAPSPVASLELGDVAIYLEGRIYAPGTLAQSLRRLAAVAFSEEDGQLEAWLRDVDGEFVAAVIELSTGRLLLLNDLLGRLPLYVSRTGERALVSRELRVLTRMLPRVRFDPLGMAEHLVFGFPLGPRTLIAGVERLPPASWIRIDARARRISTGRLPGLDLSLQGDGRSAGDRAEHLADLFAAACRTRAASDGHNVVSLSGGADSRAVAACLHREGIPFRCVTFLDAEGLAAADAEVAERLATLFGVSWQLVRLASPSAEDRRRLLRLKSGLNPLSMAYLVPYLEQVQSAFGRDIVFLTGDGGDKVLPDLRLGAARDATGLATELVRTHQIFSPAEASALTGVPVADLIQALRERLEGYPEADWAARKVHFEIFERAFKWLFEGEDRNRAYFWSTSPFYAAPFFRAAMRCDPAAKAHRALYREFLVALSPAAAGVEYAGIGAAIDSPAFRVAAKAASLLARHASRTADALVQRDSTPAAIAALELLRRQAERCPLLFESLDRKAVDTFLEGTAATRPRALDVLSTLASAIEDLHSS